MLRIIIITILVVSATKAEDKNELLNQLIEKLIMKDPADARSVKLISEAQKDLMDKGVLAFDSLLSHLDDKRLSQSFDATDTEGNLLGNVCYSIIIKNMYALNDPSIVKHSRKILPLVVRKKNIKDWLKHRKDKSLEEIQLDALKEISPKFKKDNVELIEAVKGYIDSLEKN